MGLITLKTLKNLFSLTSLIQINPHNHDLQFNILTVPELNTYNIYEMHLQRVEASFQAHKYKFVSLTLVPASL